MPAPYFRRFFRFVATDGNGQNFCTSISVQVPTGLTRTEAVAYVTGVVAGEISRYAAWEAMCLGPIDRETDWSEKVT